VVAKELLLGGRELDAFERQRDRLDEDRRPLGDVDDARTRAFRGSSMSCAMRTW